jgi:hypothetical protein
MPGMGIAFSFSRIYLQPFSPPLKTSHDSLLFKTPGRVD